MGRGCGREGVSECTCACVSVYVCVFSVSEEKETTDIVYERVTVQGITWEFLN